MFVWFWIDGGKDCAGFWQQSIVGFKWCFFVDDGVLVLDGRLVGTVEYIFILIFNRGMF